MKTFLTILITAAIAAAATWFFMNRAEPSASSAAPGGERKVLYYQSAMHPWIKSDQPGRCTICGMELTPVYEGEKGFDESGGENVVALTQTQIQVLHVQTEEAAVRPLTRSLRVAGMIDDDQTRHRILSAYVDGRIEKLHVNYIGAEVEEGQPLAEIYSPPLLQAEREYRQLAGPLKENVRFRLRQMGLTDEQIAELDQKPADALTSEILAPIGGTVVAQNVYEGQTVSAGDSLFEIADFSTMWFVFRAYEQDMPWIGIGGKVTVTTPALPGQEFEGEITFIDPNFDEATRSTGVRVELPNPPVDGRRALLHRLFADGIVHVDAEPALTVPRSAVIRTGAEAVVYIDQTGGAYERTPITLGRRGDKFVEVLSGLQPGDRVVTNGNLLIDGQAEMNRAFMTSAEETEAPHADADDALTETQIETLERFIATADAMAAALSADDLAAFNKASEPAMDVTEALVRSLENRDALREPLGALSKSSHFHGFADLQGARVAFHPFSTAATHLAGLLKTTPGVPEHQVWECPMVDQAIPGVPKRGRWLQAGGRPGHNPFFGDEMLECGKQIQP